MKGFEWMGLKKRYKKRSENKSDSRKEENLEGCKGARGRTLLMCTPWYYVFIPATYGIEGYYVLGTKNVCYSQKEAWQTL